MMKKYLMQAGIISLCHFGTGMLVFTLQVRPKFLCLAFVFPSLLLGDVCAVFRTEWFAFAFNSLLVGALVAFLIQKRALHWGAAGVFIAGVTLLSLDVFYVQAHDTPVVCSMCGDSHMTRFVNCCWRLFVNSAFGVLLICLGCVCSLAIVFTNLVCKQGKVKVLSNAPQ